MLMALAVVLLPAGPALAQYLGGNGVHIDVTVQENASDGRMSIHGFDFDVLPELGLIEDKRAFVRGVELSGILLLAQDPGFVARLSSTELSPAGLVPPAGGEDLFFNVLSPPVSTMSALGGRAISFWDGSLPVSWGPVPDADERIRIINGSFFNPTVELVISSGANANIEGFAVATSLGSGSLHHHMKWLLLPDNGELPPLGPDDGIYLSLYEFSMPSYSEWIPVFIGVEAFAGGTTARNAALTSIEDDFQLPLCSDGIDNDKDGTTDLADAGCTDADDMSERGAVTECDNGIDDDGDGFVDFHDLDGDGVSDYGGDTSCLHPTNARELTPEPGFALAIAVGIAGLVGLSGGRRDAC